MNRLDDHDAVRLAIQEAFPEIDQRGSLATLPPGYTYLPQSHALALDPDATIVTGIRGSGKSHWYTYLADKGVQAYLVDSYKNVRINTATDIIQGFGTGGGGSIPSPGIIKQITMIDPDAAWRSVLGSALSLPDPFPVSAPWADKTAWVRDNLEAYERLLMDLDERLATHGQSKLVLFDALDRVADEWKSIRVVVKSLLRLALEVRSYRSIRMKLFVRPDMIEDETIMAFPDASKLLAKTQELTWRRTDLYAVFFQRLANTAGFGATFADFVSSSTRLAWTPSVSDPSRVLNERLRFDEDLQARIFHAMTGPTMAGGASGHKRGIPYSWLVNHLMDSRDQVSPRSFYSALKKAAQFSGDGTWEYALSPRAIQSGVIEASGIRQREIQEDYPWVSRLMNPLGEKKLVVPCQEAEIREIWEECGAIDSLSRMIESGGDEVKLPPRHRDEGPRGLISDLSELGIMYRLLDGKIQVPDVFRISYRLGRRGGVRPLR